MTPHPVLLSTDIGSDIDDALALLTLLNHPAIDLRGIYTVNGDLDARCFIAKHIVTLARRDIPVARGIADPLWAVVAPHTFFESCLVDDTYIDEDRMEEECSPEILHRPLEACGIIRDGISHLAAQLRQQSHIVLNIAPMTNIAVLLRDFPDVVGNIIHLYVMGFTLNGRLEHNVRFDSEAASRILESGIPTTIIPGDVCEQWRLPASPETQFRSPAGMYVTSMLHAFLGAKIVDACRQSDLLQRLKSTQIRLESAQRIGTNEFLKRENSRHTFTVNFDETAACLDRERFLWDLQRLLKDFEDPRLAYPGGPELACEMRPLLRQDISIADAYVPYCLLHPDRVRTKRLRLRCDAVGGTIVELGEQHEVVTEVDLEHFRAFLADYLI